MMKKLLWLLPVLAMVAAGSWFLLKPPPMPEPYTGMGGEFTLRSAQGPVSLSDFRGNLVLIYFGYTSCPDICPTSLGALSAALKKLSPEEMAHVQPLFISVDPERDTSDKLVAYARYFHPKMVGLTGSLEQLEEIADRYGAYFRKAEVENSTLGYAVDHSSVIYVVNPKGVLVDMIHHSGSVNAILERIRAALAQGS
ncbi:MAG TPA: SCO family protein [Chromatiaceae bacterium]|nr:SCO family protein [Chromatiaceae bacterium]